MIGSTIGLTFAVSLVASPWLNHIIGVPGIFALTGVLSIIAIGVVYAVIPDVPEPASVAAPLAAEAAPGFFKVLSDPQLARLNFGILALHAVLMALFIVVPLSLRDAGLPIGEHWRIYLPVMLGSFVLMVPAILIAERRGRVKFIFVGAVGLLLAGQLTMPWLMGSVLQISVFLLIFFSAFNVLEAMLPSLTSKLAPPGAKGAAIGVYSSVQFLGTFIGAACGGFLYQHWGAGAVFGFDFVLLFVWLALAAGMKAPPSIVTRAYALPELDNRQGESLAAQLRAQPGVRDVKMAPAERTAYLKVDAKRYDERVVLRLIEDLT
jgi:predicted MFS family arabinose efflux permease